MTYLLAFLSGGFSVAAYAPLELWWLMPICMMLLFQLLIDRSEKESFLLAFLFAFGQFGVGASWIYVSLQTYGNMPIWMAIIAVILFVGLCAAVTGVFGFVYAKYRFKQTGIFNAVLFSAIWVLAEWLRSVLFTGFPWLDIGYSQTTQWLSAYAPIGSVYLVSFVCALISACFGLTIRHCISYRQQLVTKVKSHLITPVFLILVIVITGLLLQNIQWSEANGKSYRVAIIQGNTSIEEKWQNQYQSKILGDYFRLIQQHQADLVLLAETALPVYLHQTDAEFWTTMKGQNTAILSGIVERDFEKQTIYNSANLVCGENQTQTKENSDFYQGEQIYRKKHLVPFGEYLPFRNLLSWVLNYLQIPMSDFSAGEGLQSLECDGLKISLSICYEDAFASEIRQSLSELNGAGILVNISEDAWFGNSLAPHQRVQMAQMRAIETARPMLRSANSGPSTHINYQGKILSSTQQFMQDSILVEVQPRIGTTPFSRFGLWIILFCFMFAIAAVLFKYRQFSTN